MTTGLSINRGSHPEKLVWREGRRLTSPEVWAAVTSKVWRYPFLLLTQEDKRRLYSQAVLSPVNMLSCLCYFLKLWRPSNLAFQQKQKATHVARWRKHKGRPQVLISLIWMNVFNFLKRYSYFLLLTIGFKYSFFSSWYHYHYYYDYYYYINY